MYTAPSPDVRDEVERLLFIAVPGSKVLTPSKPLEPDMGQDEWLNVSLINVGLAGLARPAY